MEPAFGTIHLWAHCPSAARPASSEAVSRLLTDSAREAMAARYATEVLAEGGTSAAELTGRAVRGGGEITAEIAADAETFVTTMRANGFSFAHQDVRLSNTVVVPNVSAWLHPSGAAARMNYSWRYVRPDEDPRLVITGQSRLIVFQPRAARASPWAEAVTSNDIFQRIAANAADVTADHDIAVPGSHCTQCSHRVECAALTRALDAEYDRPPGTHAGGRIPAAMLGAELAHARRVAALAESRAKALEAEVRARLTTEYVEGWAFEPTSERQWSVEPSTVEFALGIKLVTEVIRSPAQAEKAGANKDAVAQLVKNVPTGRRLVQHDARRITKLFRR
jgi:hypothetical protein